MAEHWHLSPQTGEVKGNNPYQRNRMTVDSSFRTPTGGYDLANIQGYSATGDVIFKGGRLSLAPPRAAGLGSKMTGSVTAANTECNIAEYPSQQGGSSHHHRHHHQRSQSQSQSQKVQFRGQQTDVVIGASQTQKSRSDGYTPADWQSNTVSQSHMGQLNDLTEARYKAIMSESVRF